MPGDVTTVLLRLRCFYAAQRFEVALRRLQLLLERRYSPDQPRVPAGRPDGGRWTNVPSSTEGEFLSPAREDTLDRVAQNEALRKYHRNLMDEEGVNGGIGHTIRRHVGRSDDSLVAELRAEWLRYDTPLITAIVSEPKVGTFRSLAEANDFVNRTLEANKDLVDSVGAGTMEKATLRRRFGYDTGREAFIATDEGQIQVRTTYEVKVLIVHDPRYRDGYAIRTAYPWNEGPKRGRTVGNPDDEE